MMVVRYLSIMSLVFTIGCSHWTRLPDLPDKEGFAGAYAGVSRGQLVVAGGSNFPDKKPWEGGKKSFYDSIFALNRPDGTWKLVGHLPKPTGYGVAVTYNEKILCIAGGDLENNYADAFAIDLTKSGDAVITPLPSLPVTSNNLAGAILGDTLYVAGGQEKPTSTTAHKIFYSLDLASPDAKWKALDPWPGPGRILPVAASLNGAFYLVGGAELSADENGKPKRAYLKDAYRFDPKTGWSRISDLPHPLVAGPTPAPTDTTGFYLLGGDDGSRVGFQPIAQHPGFNPAIYRYDALSNQWQHRGELPAARVTTTFTRWNNLWIIPSGEAHPGVRSPQVWGLDFDRNKP